MPETKHHEPLNFWSALIIGGLVLGAVALVSAIVNWIIGLLKKIWRQLLALWAMVKDFVIGTSIVVGSLLLLSLLIDALSALIIEAKLFHRINKAIQNSPYPTVQAIRTGNATNSMDLLFLVIYADAYEKKYQVPFDGSAFKYGEDKLLKFKRDLFHLIRTTYKEYFQELFSGFYGLFLRRELDEKSNAWLKDVLSVERKRHPLGAFLVMLRFLTFKKMGMPWSEVWKQRSLEDFQRNRDLFIKLICWARFDVIIPLIGGAEAFVGDLATQAANFAQEEYESQLPLMLPAPIDVDSVVDHSEETSRPIEEADVISGNHRSDLQGEAVVYVEQIEYIAVHDHEDWENPPALFMALGKGLINIASYYPETNRVQDLICLVQTWTARYELFEDTFSREMNVVRQPDEPWGISSFNQASFEFTAAGYDIDDTAAWKRFCARCFVTSELTDEPSMKMSEENRQQDTHTTSTAGLDSTSADSNTPTSGMGIASMDYGAPEGFV